MKIAVLAAAVPFTASPVRRLAAELVSAFERCGHQALLVMLPLPAGPLTAEHVLGLRALRLPNVDRAVAIGFPACTVEHPDKVVWMADGVLCPHACYLLESRGVYVASRRAALRLKEEGGVEAAVLTPPAGGAGWRRIAETLAA